jgi:hypothetical protein
MLGGGASHAQVDKETRALVSRQVLVMFEAESKEIQAGALSLSTASSALPERLTAVLSRYGANKLDRAILNFERADTLRIARDGRKLFAPDYTRLYKITLPSAADVDSVVAKLNRLPFVKYAEANQIAETRHLPPAFSLNNADSGPTTMLSVVPNDTRYSEQYNLRYGGTLGIDAERAWGITTGSASVILGMVDSGVGYFNHSDLSPRFTGMHPSGSDPHGTEVGGIIGANTNNSFGIAGVDWSARVHSDLLSFDLAQTAEAITRTVNQDALVINNSWGFASRSNVLSNALSHAYRSNVLLVHANPYQTGSASATSNYPNDVGPWILNVGASNQLGGALSNTGARSFTDVSAPGDRVLTTTLGGGHTFKSGTSFSAPHVTGIAGLLLSANPSLRNYDLEQIIKRTAHRWRSGEGHDPRLGFGMANAYEALRMVTAPNVVVHGPAQFTKISSNTTRTFVNGPALDLAAGVYYDVDVYRLQASGNFSFANAPQAWLSVSEPGFSAANPNNGQRWMQESISTTGYSALTFFYYIRKNAAGQRINRWVPFDPRVYERQDGYGFTAIGVPATPPLTATLSGTSEIFDAGTGSWTAQASGGSGSGSYTFRWYHQTPSSNTFALKATRTKSQSSDSYSQHLSGYGFHLIRAEVTRGSETASRDWLVEVRSLTDPPGDCEPEPPFLDPCVGFLTAEDPLPTVYALHGAAPNPARGAAEVRYDLPEASHVRLAVFDVLGREVLTLTERYEEAGAKRLPISVDALPAGPYLIRLDARGSEGDFARTVMMTVVD